MASTVIPTSSGLTQTFDLVRRAQRGEGRALERLFARYYDRVRAIVRHRLGPNLRELWDSCDVVQETFIHAIRAFDRFEMRDEASVIGWLARIAEHTIKGIADHKFADKRNPPGRVPIGERSSEYEGPQVRDGRPGPYESIEQQEQVERVQRCLVALPDEYREIIMQRNYKQRSWREVAKRTGRPTEDAARMMYARALLELRRRMRGLRG